MWIILGILTSRGSLVFTPKSSFLLVLFELEDGWPRHPYLRGFVLNLLRSEMKTPRLISDSGIPDERDLSWVVDSLILGEELVTVLLLVL